MDRSNKGVVGVAEKADRDYALDFVKGICVFAMIVHHCLNYFPYFGVRPKYVAFVTGAFPFLAGFLATSILSNRKIQMRCWKQYAGKLWYRGLRLLILCGVLNLFIVLLIPGNQKGADMDIMEWLYVMYIKGDYHRVAFDLLVVIGYVLWFLSFLCFAKILNRKVMLVIACCAVAYCSIVYYDRTGGYYLTFISCGLMGAASGFAPKCLLMQSCKHLIGLGVGIGLWQLVIAHLQQPSPIYFVNILLVVLFLYGLGQRLRVKRVLIQWGQNTLILYFGQICVLVILRQLLKPFDANGIKLLIAFFVTVGSQYLIVSSVEYLRGYSQLFNKTYRIVLG